MLPELARRIVTEYSRPGGLVVDPMAGIGTTVVEAAALGRRSIGVELEARWLDLAATNVEEALAPSERSLVELRLGDATRLAEIGGDLSGRVDLVCTSPPYACEAGVIDKPAWIAGASLCPSDSLNYSTERANLGHARGTAYESGVARVYAGCFDLLRPGGVLAVVTKNTRRRGRTLDLAGLTVALAREAGFTYLQHVVALHVAIRDGELVGRPSFMAHDWLLWLVGREKGETQRGIARSSEAGEAGSGRREVGLAEAAEICGVSLPTVRRRWQDGLLPGAYRNDHGQVRVPEQALAKIRSKREHQPIALSQAVVSEALWILRRVLAFARANGLLMPGFDPTEGLEAPSPDPAKVRRRQPTRQPRPLTLPECRRIAAHLHPVHQTAFWLQRIMGLRISESFGVLVSDVVDLGDSALLAIQGQGGRSFSVRDEHGTVVAVPYRATTKTAAGSRVLVLPKAMAELIKVAVESFHTDPTDGTVATEARLVPGLQAADEGGQLGFRQAFEDAAIKEHLTADDLGFTVSPHLLRKSLATDLAWETGIEDTVRRRFMGHRVGDDVFGRIYTLDHPEVTPLVKVAAALDRQIEASIGSLLASTTTKMKWGESEPDHRTPGSRRRDTQRSRMARRSGRNRRSALQREARRRRVGDRGDNGEAVDGRRDAA
jgi:integrase